MAGWLDGNFVSVIDGVAFGLLLFTIAVGLSLVFGMMDVLNLAHGTLYLGGAYVAYTLSDGSVAGLLLALTAGALTGALGGAALTLGITFIVADLLAEAFGGEVLPTDPPEPLRGTVDLLGHTYPVYRLVFIAVAAGLATLVYLVFERSSLGALVRATVADRDMVRAQGVLHDQTADGYRYLHVGLPGRAPAGLWLMPATTDQERELIGRQCGGRPLLVLYTANMQQTADHLPAHGVRVWDEREEVDSRSLHFEDLYGNVIVAAQLPVR